MNQQSKLQSDSIGLESPALLYLNHQYSNVNPTDPNKFNSPCSNKIDFALNFIENASNTKYSLKSQFVLNKNLNEEPNAQDSCIPNLNSSNSSTSSQDFQTNQSLKNNNPNIEKELSDLSSNENSNSRINKTAPYSTLMEFFEQKDGKIKLDFSKIFELFQEWMDILLEQEILLKYKADYIINSMHHFVLLKSSMKQINQKIDTYNNKLKIFDDTVEAIGEEYHTYSKLLQTADKILSNNADLDVSNQNNESRNELYSSVNKFQSDMKIIIHKIDELDSPFNRCNLLGSQTYTEMTETLANFSIITSLIKDLINNVTQSNGLK